MGDAPIDQFQLTPEGLLTRMTHPQWTAPWKPEMHDGDLIILADFHPDTYAVIATEDRFTLNQVMPVMPRGGAPVGFAKNRDRNSYNFVKRRDMLVAQNFRADRRPDEHVFYNIPVTEPVFPGDYPPLPVAPPGTDPDDYTPVPAKTGEVSMVLIVLAMAAIGIAIIGSLAVLAFSTSADSRLRKERVERRAQVDDFLKRQCERDKLRDEVFAQALKDAQNRVRASIPRNAVGVRDGIRVNLRAYELSRLQNTINRLGTFYGKCINALPKSTKGDS
jgi:hypothetical protein